MSSPLPTWENHLSDFYWFFFLSKGIIKLSISSHLSITSEEITTLQNEVSFYMWFPVACWNYLVVIIFDLQVILYSLSHRKIMMRHSIWFSPAWWGKVDQRGWRVEWYAISLWTLNLIALISCSLVPGQVMALSITNSCWSWFTRNFIF